MLGMKALLALILLTSPSAFAGSNRVSLKDVVKNLDQIKLPGQRSPAFAEAEDEDEENKRMALPASAEALQCILNLKEYREVSKGRISLHPFSVCQTDLDSQQGKDHYYCEQNMLGFGAAGRGFFWINRNGYFVSLTPDRERVQSNIKSLDKTMILRSSRGSDADRLATSTDKVLAHIASVVPKRVSPELKKCWPKRKRSLVSRH